MPLPIAGGFRESCTPTAKAVSQIARRGFGFIWILYGTKTQFPRETPIQYCASSTNIWIVAMAGNQQSGVLYA
jgi:hypothetical protein